MPVIPIFLREIEYISEAFQNGVESLFTESLGTQLENLATLVQFSIVLTKTHESICMCISILHTSVLLSTNTFLICRFRICKADASYYDHNSIHHSTSHGNGPITEPRADMASLNGSCIIGRTFGGNRIWHEQDAKYIFRQCGERV